MNAMHPIDFFLSQTDTLGACLFFLLLLMSLLSWHGIFSKALLLWRITRWGRRPPNAAAAPGPVPDHPEDPFARLVRGAHAVHGELQLHRSAGVDALNQTDELLMRCLSRIVGETGARLDNGQTLLASVAAVAPFVGLFGTVWGVHHALSAIGANGAASLEQIAGPVGEALIMTALGLAVAIPALLAYNVFARSSQKLMARLDALAHDLYHQLLTGQPLPADVRGAH